MAAEMSNSEYGQRFNRLSQTQRMKPPPSAGRKFSGYLVVRRLGLADEYETWIPDPAFEDIYEPSDSLESPGTAAGEP
jgi:hypothetical protein